MNGRNRRSVRRQVPGRRRQFQHRQQRHLLDLRARGVQEPVATAPPEGRLAVHQHPGLAVHHPGTGADARGGRDLVSGHGGRDRAINPIGRRSPTLWSSLAPITSTDERAGDDRVSSAGYGGRDDGDNPGRPLVRRRVRGRRADGRRALVRFIEKDPGGAGIPGNRTRYWRQGGTCSPPTCCSDVARGCARQESFHDFGKDIPPRRLDTDRIFALCFPRQPILVEPGDGSNYWRDTVPSTPTSRPTWRLPKHAATHPTPPLAVGTASYLRPARSLRDRTMKTQGVGAPTR